MKKNAFTLIELVLALLIFSVVTISSVSYFAVGQKQGERAKRHLYGLKLAEELLEDFKSRYFYEASGPADGQTNPPQEQTFNEFNTTFTRYYSSSYYEASVYNTHSEEYRVVQVTVTWQNGSGDTKVIQINTLISPVN